MIANNPKAPNESFNEIEYLSGIETLEALALEKLC